MTDNHTLIYFSLAQCVSESNSKARTRFNYARFPTQLQLVHQNN